MNPFQKRSVLVTGAGGSIGSQLCRLIVSGNARRLVLVSLTESGLYNIDRKLRREFGRSRDTQIVPVLGSAGDPELMDEVIQGIDVVIHAAAHKHVPLCEMNPLAAIANNVMATANLAAVSARARVGQFCLISTDKAVVPASVMGACKRVAELIVQDHAAKAENTHFFTVRFGNVADSDGSVLPLWREQIAAGGPLTLTDTKCVRFFMSIPDAVELVRRVMEMAPARGTFIFDMGPPRNLLDMAKEMIAKSERDVRISIIGLRPGEKVIEELHFGGELRATAAERVYQVMHENGKPLDTAALQRLFDATRSRDRDQAVRLLWQIAGEPHAHQ